MKDSAVRRFTLPVLAASLILGCGSRNDDASDAGESGSAPPRITGDAKVALDSGNVLFRARAYDLALAQYRRSAQLAPNDVTPLFGVLMVGEATKNARLADSARARIRDLNPSMADSSTQGHAEMIDRHSRITTPTPSPP
jgi:hypothetical protein